jgi:hypothetical protein
MPKKTKSRNKKQVAARNRCEPKGYRRADFHAAIRRINVTPHSATLYNISNEDSKTVDMDVNRSVAHWDVHQNLSKKERLQLRESLRILIVDLARSIAGFRYYQGVHEVCLVILHAHNGDTKRSLPVCRAIFQTSLAGLIHHDFTSSLVPLLDALRGLTTKFDPELAGILDQAGLGYNFAVPWLLTWFAHSVDRYNILTGIYAHLLVQENVPTQLACVYLCCAVILQTRDRIIEHKNDSCMIFRTLQSCPGNTNWSTAKVEALAMINVYTPKQLTCAFPKLRKAFNLKIRHETNFVRFGIIFGLLCVFLAALQLADRLPLSISI